jgi:protein phosphatase
MTFGQNRLRKALMLANQEIHQAAREDAGLHGMGTTAVCALLEGNRADLAHVGDSRIYLQRDGQLDTITRDHSWIHEQVSQGVISEDQARLHPYRNVVTRALGAAPEVDVDIEKIELQPGDLLLLCTDGLNSMVPDADICKILKRYGDDLGAAASALVFEANRRGGADNTTIILLELAGD